MTKDQKTWTVLALVVLMLLLVLWLFEKKRKEIQTQTSVNLGGGVSGAYQFPVRNEQNQMLLRQCSYTNGHTLTLDPNAAGGQCPPVFTGLDGNPGNLIKDEVIAIPWAGQQTVNYSPPYVPPIGDPEFTS